MKKILLFFMICHLAATAIAQQLPASCTAFSPSQLNKNTLSRIDVHELLENSIKSRNTNKYWDVYSDRCDNVAYKEPDLKSGEADRLSFCQKVRIAKIQGEFALVYTENKPGAVAFPQISGDVKCHGWVPLDNLLLWNSCPMSNTGVYRKVLIVSNLNPAMLDNPDNISQRPELHMVSKKNSKALTPSMDIHYVLKEAGTGDKLRLLIAKTQRITGSAEEVVEGWVSRNSVFVWDGRLCLEPTWTPTVVSQFASKGQGIDFFPSNRFKGAVSTFKFGKANDVEQPSTRYRMKPEATRYPIMDFLTKGGGSYRISYSPKTDGSGAAVGFVKRYSQDKSELWNMVLLFSSEELMDFTKRLEVLRNACKVTSFSLKERSDFVRAVYEVVFYYAKMTSDDMTNLNLSVLTRYLVGMDKKTPIPVQLYCKKDYKFAQILSPKKCPEEDFRLIVKGISSKIDDLMSLSKSSSFKYTFVQHGIKFYWVPIQMIP